MVLIDARFLDIVKSLLMHAKKIYVKYSIEFVDAQMQNFA